MRSPAGRSRPAHKNNNFSPDITMTRAMLATVLHRVAGTPTVSEAAPFSDVAPNTWYSDAVAWAVANEIVGGYGGGVFGVDDPVTHEQIVAILWRYDSSKTVDTEIPFADAGSISSYAVEAVRWAAENGIIADWASERFESSAGTTHAQVASMFYRYLSSKETPSTGTLEGIDVSKLEHVTTNSNAPVVYMTTDISPEGLAAVYEALNWTPTGNVAVKLSTGEAGNTHYLSPDLIKDLVQQKRFFIVMLVLSICLLIGQGPMIQQNFMYSEEVQLLSNAQGPLPFSGVLRVLQLLAMVLLPVLSVTGCAVGKERGSLVKILYRINLICSIVIVAASLFRLLAIVRNEQAVSLEYPSYVAVSYQTIFFNIIVSAGVALLNIFGLRSTQ